MHVYASPLLSIVKILNLIFHFPQKKLEIHNFLCVSNFVNNNLLNLIYFLLPSQTHMKKTTLFSCPTWWLSSKEVSVFFDDQKSFHIHTRESLARLNIMQIKLLKIQCFFEKSKKIIFVSFFYASFMSTPKKREIESNTIQAVINLKPFLFSFLHWTSLKSFLAHVKMNTWVWVNNKKYIK